MRNYGSQPSLKPVTHPRLSCDINDSHQSLLLTHIMLRAVHVQGKCEHNVLRLTLSQNTILRYAVQGGFDCWSLLNGNHTTITCSILLAGLSVVASANLQRHDTPSVIMASDPGSCSDTLPLTSKPWETKAMTSHA